MNSDPITPEEWEICARVLQCVSEDTDLIQENERLKGLIAKIHRMGKKAERLAAGETRRESDWSVQQATAIVRRDTQKQAYAQEDTADSPVGTLLRAIRCYICKQSFTQIHFFYHLLCPTCAALNYRRRNQRADLAGRIALLTGGRIKIGYQTALRLLRDGARVVVTTRFPFDAARRFAAAPDYAEWRDRLVLYGLDLRDLPSVEAFVRHLNATENHLDIIIHNAAQTIKRPLAFYQHLLDAERTDTLPGSDATATALVRWSGGKEESVPTLLEARAGYREEIAAGAFFPVGKWDADGQPMDKREKNSWVLRLHEVSTIEMLETQLVGAVAPFLLNSQLKPLLLRSPFPRRFIVNVSAMEGQFGRESKTAAHPHTNMAKASLNMMTRTSAADYATAGIYMNSVDTGWITDENPHEKGQRVQEERGFYTPLDVIDGMARVYDPIVRGITDPEEPPFGHFLKDYAPYPW